MHNYKPHFESKGTAWFLLFFICCSLSHNNTFNSEPKNIVEENCLSNNKSNQLILLGPFMVLTKEKLDVMPLLHVYLVTGTVVYK